MTRFHRLISKFLKHDGGNFATLLTVAALPILGSVGVAVDYTRMFRAESQLQASIDAAVLAAAKQLADTDSDNSISGVARDYFFTNYNGEISDSDISFTAGLAASGDHNSDGDSVGLALVATATTDYPLTIGNVLGIAQTKISVSASANINLHTIEAAFVFDASGSMTDNDVFQKSTKAATDILHDMKQFVLMMQNASGEPTEYIRYALVPFAHSVNIGTGFEGDHSTMDTLGLSFNHHRYVDWSQGYSAVSQAGGYQDGSGNWLTRWTLLDEINQDWGGCVEARPHPYFLDDTPADPLNPDTLFVPLFSPDEPDNFGGAEIDYPNQYLEDDVLSASGRIAINNSNSGNTNKQAARAVWTSKYNHHARVSPNYANSGLGPNRACLDYEVYPLTGDFGQVNSQISQINNTFATAKTIGIGDDDGATNIQQGIVWGWRTLSSMAPFTQGRPESDPRNKKVLILVSDGINSLGETASQLGSEYGAFGYLANSWLEDGITAPGTKTPRDMLDEHTLTTCGLAKAAGVSIYVVGYGVAPGSREESLLSQCSGGSDRHIYYFPVDDSTVDAAFQLIKRQLVDIRLAS